MAQLENGDLVYLPADLTLLQVSDGQVKHWLRTENPVHALLVAKDASDQYHKILYKGECWHVPKHNVHSTKEGDRDDSFAGRGI